MTNVIIPGSDRATDEAQPRAVARDPQTRIPGFSCVYLTSSVREAERASSLLESAKIRIYRAAKLGDAEARLRLTRSRVLLADTSFRGGNWTEALQIAMQRRPTTALVVAARLADENLWISVIERGAYDLVVKPFQADELRRILENAHSHATTGQPLHMTA
jgi:DNA-binding NtrC family response regulator